VIRIKEEDSMAKFRQVMVVALTLACSFILAAAQGPSAQEISAQAQRVAEELGYDDAQLRKILKYEIVSRRLGKEEKKELAVTVAILVDQPVQAVYQKIRMHELLDVDRTVYAWGVIDADAPLDALAALTLPDDQLDELAKASPGSEWNLSGPGFATIRSIAERLREAPLAERRAGLMQGYRELLAERVREYAAKGIDGIAPYSRGKGSAEPAKDLAHANPGKDSLIAEVAPTFHAALTNYPASPAASVESTLVWLLHDLNGRPVVVLGHRLVGLEHGDAFVAQRDFFVGHNFDALLVLAGCFPLGEQTIVFYGNRTYTEQVAGFASGAAHSIGRKMLIAEVVAFLESAREAVEKQPQAME
jgi:hypothetical protein